MRSLSPPFPSKILKKKDSNSSAEMEKKGVYPVLLNRDDPTKAVAYINLTILDVSEAVRNMVYTKMQEKSSKLPGPSRLKNKVSKIAAKAASQNVPPSKIAHKLSQKLPKKLMYTMYHKAGMRLAAQTVFVENEYVVMQLQVQYVDSMKLLSKAKQGGGDHQTTTTTTTNSTTNIVGVGDGDKQNVEGSTDDNDNEEIDDDDEKSVSTEIIDEWIEEQSQLLAEQDNSPFLTTAAAATNTHAKKKKIDIRECFRGITSIKQLLINILEWILLKLGGTNVHHALETQHLPALVQSKITENMMEMMSKKLESKSLKADVAVLSEQEQARYFFKHLQEIRSKSGGGGEPNGSSGSKRVANDDK